MEDRESILSKYPLYKTDIGIEVHVQLNTKSKIFCGCSNSQSSQPNTFVCPICAGYPGVLPVLNAEVVKKAICAALATHSCINEYSVFSRKHYFYPDLPKNYQITQGNQPFCSEGYIIIRKENGSEKKIRLMRIHIEEDAGKNIHASGSNESFVDLNRTGTPLLEIVSYPDIESAEEAKLYLQTLHTIIRYIGISTANMEEGSFRADSNVSVRKKNAINLGTRCELKNINSFKFVSDAIEYEIERQIMSLESGIAICQETRLWDSKKHITFSMRSKEEAADYRYFDDPDLPIIHVDALLIDEMKKYLPELPDDKFYRFRKEYSLHDHEIKILIDDQKLANYYEEAQKNTKSKQLINWILRDLLGYLKENKITLDECKISPMCLSELMNLLEEGTINNRVAQELFLLIGQTGKSPIDLVREYSMHQVDDILMLDKIVQDVIQNNQSMVFDYKSGKIKLFGFFVGQVMQKTNGKGNPKIINELLQKKLS